MAPSDERNGASDHDSSTRKRSRGSQNPGGQPLWLSWVQLGISTMLVVLFLVMLGKVREQATTIGELEQKIRTIENERSQDRTKAMEQQLESMIQRLQSVEQVGDQLRNVDRQQQALKQDLQQLRNTPHLPVEALEPQSSPNPTPPSANPMRSPLLPGSPKPSPAVVRPPSGNF
jgi:septal ring factor EnvC (AmiA/AmiB activator)